ncbi:hypothetical protein [Novosphingobium sp.]|uniref:hypothetical protein n=1 Tax=Novosphingobium sp. TaxID=1874826 RepID=UPI0038BD0006
MILTFIGAVQTLLGLSLFLGGTIEAMFGFLLVSALFGGSAAVTLPALGTGSSIPPVQFALVFMAMRLFVPGAGQMAAIGRAARANVWLASYVFYGVVLAYVAPRIFAGMIDVTPLRGRTEVRYSSFEAYLFATRPLKFTTQNITTSIYLCGTLLVAMAAHIICSNERGRLTLIRTMAIVGMIHSALGFLSVLGKNTPIDAGLMMFRNASYAQLDNAYQGFVRMTGIWPEASGYAAFAMVWFVFVFECWMRRIETRFTFPAALALLAALVFSTSSLAYVGLPFYAILLITRAMVFPGAVSLDRALWMAAAALAMTILVGVVLAVHPLFADQFIDLVKHMTIDKSGSTSGTQRRFWAMQGISAFWVSGGIGIGPGSFRSSSLVTAVLGCTGVVGAITLTLHFVRAFKPLRHSTYASVQDPTLATGAACAWALVQSLFVSALALPGCDPGTDFAILTGAALALRIKPVRWVVARGPAPLLLRDAVPAFSSLDDLPVPNFTPPPPDPSPALQAA